MLNLKSFKIMISFLNQLKYLIYMNTIYMYLPMLNKTYRQDILVEMKYCQY